MRPKSDRDAAEHPLSDHGAPIPPAPDVRCAGGHFSLEALIEEDCLESGDDYGKKDGESDIEGCRHELRR